MFVQGQIYSRTDLHSRYGGQGQGGISTPARYDLIFRFTAESGKQFGYTDGWSDSGIYLYTGEGQVGDMVLTHGNAAIRDHLDRGKELHLFERSQNGQWRYLSQMVCTGFQEREGADRLGNLRKVIVFELTPAAQFADDTDPMGDEVDTEVPLEQLPLAQLWERALRSSSPTRDPTERKTAYRLRSQAIKVYALRRANGTCEGCGQLAPFQTMHGQPYLEVHHIYRLSDGGPDHPAAVVAICPNCQRRAHHSQDQLQFREHLIEVVQQVEAVAVLGTGT